MLHTHAEINTDSLSSLSILYENRQRAAHTSMKTERVVKHVKIKDYSDLEQIYQFGAEIGEGGFGKVFAVKEKANQHRWAIKAVSKSLSGAKLVFLQREMQILKMVDHPHIIYLDRVYETPRKIYLIMELCTGELWRLFNERKPFAEDITKKIVKDLVSAVVYLHKYDIVHRDIKLENILLAKNPNDPFDEYYIKLSDFGLSVIKTGSGIESMLHECCGTAVYMAPEMITGSYSHQCDVWAIGVIMYLLIYCSYPFYSANEKELARKICKEEVQYPQQAKLSVEVVQLMKQALKKDPAYRITSAEMAESSWLSDSDRIPAKANVIDMMKEWKSEMMVHTGEASDWVSTAESRTTKVRDDDDSNRSFSSKTQIRSPKKQPLNIPVTDIRFNRTSTDRENKRGSRVEDTLRRGKL